MRLGRVTNDWNDKAGQGGMAAFRLFVGLIRPPTPTEASVSRNDFTMNPYRCLRTLVAAAALACASVVCSAVPAGLPDTSKMNVLFVIIEDTNAGAIGCYGNTICQTPNLDHFARTAVQFNSAYVQAVSCNPSRTSFLTGLRPLTSGVWNNNQRTSEHVPPGTKALPQLLKEHGLYTAVIGKFFHGTDYARPQMMYFDRIEHAVAPPGWKGPPPILPAPVLKEEVEKPPMGRNDPGYREWRRQRSDRYGDSGLKPEEESDYYHAAAAVALLEQFARRREPFFLSMHQSHPHTPLTVPKKYIDMYDPEKIPLPPAPVSSLNLAEFPYAKRSTGRNNDIFTKVQPTAQQAKEAIAAYYACLSFVDDNVGRVLDALDRTGLAKNTIVVVMADHGFHLGDHGLWSKYTMLEATRRAPLWVRVPGAPANGRVCNEFVEFVDLIPTLGDLLDFKVPSAVEGTSFAPLLVNPERPWKKAVFQVTNPLEQMVRTRRYSYLEFKDGPVPAALYDLKKDPWETVNLASDPGHAAVRAEMAGLLHAGWKSALPPKP